jgi:hypothetical protein
MNPSLFNVLQHIANEHGEDVLNNPKRVQGLVADMAAGEAKAEKKALAKCFELGFYAEFKNSDEPEQTKAALVARLQREEGFARELSEDSVALIAALADALRPKPETPVENSDVQTGQADGQQPQPESATESARQPISETPEGSLKTRDDEIRQLKETMQKTKSGLIAAIIVGFIAVAVSIGVGVSKYNNLMDAYNGQSRKLTTAETEKSELENLVNSFEWRWSINVTSIKIGNSNNGRQLASPGTSLNARDIRYLTPEITYSSLASRDVTFYVKIIDPDGDIFRNPSISPRGSTYSQQGFVTRGSHQKLGLDGWGNGDRGIYWAGTWTVEVWLEGVCLRSEKVRLN